MEVESTDRAAGDPSLFVRFGDDLRGLGIDRFVHFETGGNRSLNPV